MKGIVIWAHSTCRSTLFFYQGLALAFRKPYEIYVIRKESNLREKIGFCDDEYNELNIKYPKTYEEALEILKQRKDWNHLFGCYQEKGNYQRLMYEANTRGISFAIASEAPCNMDSYPRRILKHIYMNIVLPFKLKPFCRMADFIINFSGLENFRMKKVGWKDEKIIPCGYYSPAIPNSHLVKRTEENWKNFTILLTGIHKVHRSPMVLLEALHLLDERNIKYICNITQEGPLLATMKQYASSKSMKNVHFLGFISMKELISLYENCSVFVGAGNNEPWGMRLNDALQCGAPLIVNKGMGGFMLVDEHDCGLIFSRGKSKELADCLERMITDRGFYLQCAYNAFVSAEKTKPANKASEIVEVIKSRFNNWS